MHKDDGLAEHKDHYHDEHHNHDNSGHDHTHSSGENRSEQLIALLSYMVDHNRSHANEIRDLGKDISGEAKALLNSAVDLFDKGNADLALALKILKEE